MFGVFLYFCSIEEFKMNTLPTLISDLAIILMTAGIITLLFKAIKQPVVLGYILAGIVAGPSLHFFHITDMENVKTWADIGVIFLLFSLGLDFSFKKLLNVGGTAIITTLTVVCGMMSVGFLTGKLLGWSHLNCLFLGGMLSMSSTTIIVKSFEDLGLRNKLFAGLVVGVLIVEDLVAVVLMVLLSTISVSSDFSGTDLLLNIFRLFMFLLIWFALGIYILPSVLKKTRKWMNNETLLVVSLALCLTMVMIATSTGFSAALGAFVMGSLLAETVDAEKIEKLTRPVKDLFGAVFFVSVGMMINPMGLLQYWYIILIITVVVIVGQIAFGTVGMLLSGQTLKVAVQSGFCLAQVGEFAFIIASLGESLHVTNDALYPIIVAVSVITTFFTPYFIKMAEPAHEFLTTHLSSRWLAVIQNLSASVQANRGGNEISTLVKSMLGILVFYGTICIAIMFFGLSYLSPFMRDVFSSRVVANVVSAVIIITCMLPFMRAILVKKNRTIKRMMSERNMNRGPLIALVVFRMLLCSWLVVFVLGKLFKAGFVLLLLIALLILVFTLLSKFLKRSSIFMENRFIDNLTQREQAIDAARSVRKEFVNHLLDRDIHLGEFEVHPQSPNVGHKLKEIHMRQTYGVNIVAIVRGDKRINIPGGEEMLFPNDKLTVAGTDEQLQAFDKTISDFSSRQNALKKNSDVHLEQFLLEDNSPLIGKTIKTALLRDKYRCMVVGIERGKTSMMNPDIDEDFRAEDILLLAGERQRIENLIEDFKCRI